MKNIIKAVLYGGFSFVIVLAFGRNVLVSLLCFAVLSLFSFIMFTILNMQSQMGESVHLSADSADQKEETLRLLIANCRLELIKVEKLSDQITDDAIQEKIGNVLRSANKIIEQVRPEQVNQTRTFYDYYIPETRKILESYVNLQSTGEGREALGELGEKVSRFLSVVDDGLEKSIDNLLHNDIAMAKVDMDVMESTLKSEGLLDDGLRRVQTEE